MNVKKRKLTPAMTSAIGVAAVLLILVAGWFLLVAPQRSRGSELGKEIDAVNLQISQARAAQVAAKSFEPIKVADLFRLTKAMPADTDMSGVLLELSRVAAETGIEFESITPGTTVAGSVFRVQPIDLVFTGDFYSLSDFLYRLRNLVAVQRGALIANGRLFTVDKLQFVEAHGGFPQIQALLTVSAFLYGSGPVAGAAPAAAATTTAATGETTPPTDTTQPATPSAAGAP